MSTSVKILDLACDITRNDRLKFENIYKHVPTGELHQFLQEFLEKYSGPGGIGAVTRYDLESEDCMGGWASRDVMNERENGDWVRYEDVKAAIAAQEPKQAMTDVEIKAVATAAVKGGTLSWLGYEKDADDKYTIPALSQSHYQFARAILAASSPNKELVAALQDALAVIDDYLAYDHNGDPWTEDARTMGEMDINDYQHDGRLDAARAALRAAGVDREPVAAPEECGACHGSGWVVRDADIGTEQECFSCDGSGKATA